MFSHNKMTRGKTCSLMKLCSTLLSAQLYPPTKQNQLTSHRSTSQPTSLQLWSDASKKNRDTHTHTPGHSSQHTTGSAPMLLWLVQSEAYDKKFQNNTIFLQASELWRPANFSNKLKKDQLGPYSDSLNSPELVYSTVAKAKHLW